MGAACMRGAPQGWSAPSETVDWLVIGGGPCGTMSVGALLERNFPEEGQRVGWIEAESFESLGRLSTYSTVPANAKNEWLCDVFGKIRAFEFEKRQRIRLEKTGSALLGAPPQETCEIQHAVDALRDASVAMRESGRLAVVRDRCRAHHLEFDGEYWNVSCFGVAKLAARRVLIAPGAIPKPVTGDLRRDLDECGITLLDHDDVVVPVRCSRLRSNLVPAAKTIGVVGGSHSGYLAAKNLIENGVPRVVVYARTEPRFARDMGGWIKHPGTGLRGQVASWTRRNLNFSPRLITRTHDIPAQDPAPDNDAARRLLELFLRDDLDAVVFAWGFQRVPLPDCVYLDNPIEITQHNTRNGRLAPGLHGVGIGFPANVTDPQGHTEPVVGFLLNFLQYVDGVIDEAEKPIFKDKKQQVAAQHSLSTPPHHRRSPRPSSHPPASPLATLRWPSFAHMSSSSTLV